MRAGGILTYITSNSFLRTSYGLGLRRYLKEQCAIARIVDFGGVVVFESAKDTYVCIPQLIKGGQQQPRVEVCRMPIFNIQDLAGHISNNHFTIPHERLSEEAWSLNTDAEAAVFSKILRSGRPLSEFLGGRIYYGIKTGLNEAFVINTADKDRLIASDRRSAELIKPLLGGEDIRRWVFKQQDQWLIFTRRGVDIDQYPAIKRHLSRWKAELTPKESKDDKLGRKPGSYAWFEIQDDVAYHEIFDGPKIVYPDIAKYPRFSLDHSGHYLANTAYCLGSASKYLLGVLNSRLFWFTISNISIPFGIRAGKYRYRLIYQYMEKVPIRVINQADQADKAAHDAIEQLVDQVLAAKRVDDVARVQALEADIDACVYALYGLSPAEIAIIESSPIVVTDDDAEE